SATAIRDHRRNSDPEIILTAKAVLLRMSLSWVVGLTTESINYRRLTTENTESTEKGKNELATTGTTDTTKSENH
ncbi:MAG: hypothetical protein LBS70_03640, partial [Candidatus Accumulibacter sp.]|nr:hypothetical protein [Accumulibacter sp.]